MSFLKNMAVSPRFMAWISRFLREVFSPVSGRKSQEKPRWSDCWPGFAAPRRANALYWVFLLLLKRKSCMVWPEPCCIPPGFTGKWPFRKICVFLRISTGWTKTMRWIAFRFFCIVWIFGRVGMKSQTRCPPMCCGVLLWQEHWCTALRCFYWMSPQMDWIRRQRPACRSFSHIWFPRRVLPYCFVQKIWNMPKALETNLAYCEKALFWQREIWSVCVRIPAFLTGRLFVLKKVKHLWRVSGWRRVYGKKRSLRKRNCRNWSRRQWTAGKDCMKRSWSSPHWKRSIPLMQLAEYKG